MERKSAEREPHFYFVRDAMDNRPIIIGTVNPHRRVVDALSPRLPNTAGWRLWKMMHDWCGVTKAEYEDLFVRMNLEDHPTLRFGDRAVLLGDEVRRSFGVDKVFIHPQVRAGVEFRCIPHPSGRCHYYNDQTTRDLVAMMLEDLCRANKSRRS